MDIWVNRPLGLVFIRKQHTNFKPLLIGSSPREGCGITLFQTYFCSVFDGCCKYKKFVHSEKVLRKVLDFLL